MANVGSLNWLVKMEKAARAKSKANEVSDEFEEMGDKARKADRAVEDLNDSTDNAGGKLSGMGRRLGLTTGMLGLFTSGLLTAGTALLRLMGISIGGGALGSLMTWIKGLSLTGAVAWLRGLAATLGGMLLTALGKVAYAAGAVVGALEWMVAAGGATAAAGWALAAAIGAVIGLFGVWILEITGVLDWIGKLGEMLADGLPQWATDGIQTVIALFTGPLAAIGGFIVGFIRGGFDKGMEMAWQIVKIQVRAIWRTFGRLFNLLEGGWNAFAGWLESLWQGTINWLFGAWTKFVNFFRTKLQQAQQFVHDLKNAVMSGLTRAFNAVKNPVKTAKKFIDNAVTAAGNFFNDVAPKPLKDAFNWVVDKVQWLIDKIQTLIDKLQGAADAVGNAADAVPGSDIAGAAGRAGGDAASWAAGGLGDLASGEVNLPSLDVGGTVRETGAAMVHAGEVVGEPGALLEAAGLSSGGGGGGGKTLIIKEQVIEIGDQTLDISELGRAEMEELADLISEKQHKTFQQATF